MNRELNKLKPKIIEILNKSKIVRAGIFGSYARGENKKGSDIDVLIEFDGSLIDLIGLEMELKKKLRKKVDLITYKSISPYIRDNILKEEIRII